MFQSSLQCWPIKGLFSLSLLSHICIYLVCFSPWMSLFLMLRNASGWLLSLLTWHFHFLNKWDLNLGLFTFSARVLLSIIVVPSWRKPLKNKWDWNARLKGTFVGIVIWCGECQHVCELRSSSRKQKVLVAQEPELWSGRTGKGKQAGDRAQRTLQAGLVDLVFLIFLI